MPGIGNPVIFPGLMRKDSDGTGSGKDIRGVGEEKLIRIHIVKNPFLVKQK